MAHLLRQQLAGQAFAILRRPLVATLVGSLLWPVPFWRSLVAPVFLAPVGGGTGPAYLLGILSPAVVAGLLGEALWLVHPAGRPEGRPARVAPYQKSLASRLMATFVPALLLVALAGAYAANVVAARAAARQMEASLSPMAFAVRNELEWTRRAAESALSQMAAQVAPSPDRLETAATLDTRGLFAAVWALDPAGEVVATRSGTSAAPPAPTLQQMLQLARAPNRWVWTASGELLVQAPLLDRAGDVRGYLVAAIPARERIAAVLQDLEQPVQGGAYFLWPATAPSQEAWLFHASPEGVAALADAIDGAPQQNLLGRGPARFLTSAGFLGFTVPIEACDAAFGILLSPSAFAASALPVSWPILAILAVAAVGAAAASSSLTASLLRPLERLVQAAGRIARGHWSTAIQVTSPDEVGRLALAVEEMRRTLQARGQQIALLADLAEGSLEHEPPQDYLVRLLRGLLRSSEANASAVVVWAGQAELSSLVREQKAGATVPSDAWIRGLAGDLALQREAIFH
ncbi:MAG: HAMP domain-containing protein, partial [Anaerolineae bacterium]|nr:HAMP domain-containing protein [Anaerolineae bacterium]